MFDRDADPQDRSKPSPQSEALKNLCMSLQEALALPWPLAFHQLGRRSIENYLPDHALRLWQEQASGPVKIKRRQRVDALCTMRKDRPDAARQIDMKHGLLGDVSKVTRDEINQQRRGLRDADLDPLFQGLSAPVRNGLTEGFGRNIAELYADTADYLEPLFRRELDQDNPTGAEIIDSLLARL